MKRAIILLLFLGLILPAHQNYGQNTIGTANSHPSAALEINSTSRGFLISRMTTPQRNAIKSPAKGLQVYDTTTKTLWNYNGSEWLNTLTDNDATPVKKGIIQLKGDLTGTAELPIVNNDAISTYKIKDENISNTDLNAGTGGIYKGSGTLSGNTDISAGTNKLSIISYSANAFSVDNQTFSIDASKHGVGVGTSAPDGNSILDINSNSRGFLLPRMTTSERNRINSPPNGLMIYNTTIGCIEIYNGILWSNNCTPNTVIGDVKYDVRTADHNGWVLLDGRSKSLLSAMQQSNAVKLGITGTNIPDSRDRRLISAGVSALGTKDLLSSGGSLYLALSDLPNEVLSGSTTYTPTGTISASYIGGRTISTSTQTHNHIFSGGGGRGGTNGILFSDRDPSTNDVDHAPTSDAVHNHSFTMPDLNSTFQGTPGTATIDVSINGGVPQTSFVPSYLALSTFIYLGDGVISSFNCNGAVNAGTLTNGTAASGVTSIISYTGGNSGPYDTQSISSTGVTGLTAALLKGSFTNGNGTLTYTITGTPAGGGTASFDLNIGGQNCTFTRTVMGKITALNCAGAVQNGILYNNTVASSSLTIPYTGGYAGPYNAQSIASTGVTGLTASLAAGNFNSGAGNLTYSITGTPSGFGTAAFNINIGGQSCSASTTVMGIITALNCTGATAVGTLTNGTAAVSVSGQIPYTGGTAGPFNAQSISSTGVTGLTAVINAGNIASGSGNISYIITGTPADGGTASFDLNIGGQKCTFTRTVMGKITALNCAGATVVGTLTNGTAASSSLTIPYTGGYAGPYNPQSIASTGVTGLTASLAAGNFNSGAGNLTYTITGTPSGGGNAAFAFNIGGQSCSVNTTVMGKITALNCAGSVNTGMLVVNNQASGVNSTIPYSGGAAGPYSGQSIPSTGVTGLTATLTAGNFVTGSGNITYTITGIPNSLGYASFIINIGGQTCTLTREVIPCGAYVSPGVYKTFMCYNLGAADTTAPANVPQQAIHGGYYQWGRATQVANAYSSTTPITGWSTAISPSNSWLDTSKTVADPCPTGYRVPTQAQWQGVLNYNSISRIGSWIDDGNFTSAVNYGSGLSLPLAGARFSVDGRLLGRGYNAYYWSSTMFDSKFSYEFVVTPLVTKIQDSQRYSGNSVRCISE